jgi:proline-specific peptidase
MTTSWPTSTEGTIPFIVDGETYQTYYRVFGDLKNASKLPLIVCHGGPGLTHDYLLPLSDLSLSEDSRPVIFYDQLGNGRSTHIHDKPSIWSFDLFIDELVNLIKFFEFQEYDILGHSWGGVLLSEFEVRRQPKGLKHAILSSSLAASALWGRSTMELLSAFPKEVQESVSVGMKDPKRFREGLAPFHAAHGNTVKPLPKEYFDSLYAAIGDDGDPTVSQGMCVLCDLLRIPQSF